MRNDICVLDDVEPKLLGFKARAHEKKKPVDGWLTRGYEKS